jgi:hypothetical protein
MALVRTDVSEKLSASMIRVTRIGKLGTLAVTDEGCGEIAQRKLSPYQAVEGNRFVKC